MMLEGTYLIGMVVPARVWEVNPDSGSISHEISREVFDWLSRNVSLCLLSVFESEGMDLPSFWLELGPNLERVDLLPHVLVLRTMRPEISIIYIPKSGKLYFYTNNLNRSVPILSARSEFNLPFIAEESSGNIYKRFLVTPPRAYDLLLDFFKRLVEYGQVETIPIDVLGVLRDLILTLYISSVRYSASPELVLVGEVHHPVTFVRYSKVPFDFYMWRTRTTAKSEGRSVLALQGLPLLFIPYGGRFPLYGNALLPQEHTQWIRHRLKPILEIVGARVERRELPKKLLDMLLRGKIPEDILNRIVNMLNLSTGEKGLTMLITLPKTLEAKFFPRGLLEELELFERAVWGDKGYSNKLDVVTINYPEEDEDEEKIHEMILKKMEELTSEGTFSSLTLREALEMGFIHLVDIARDREALENYIRDIFIRPLATGEKYSTYLITGASALVASSIGKVVKWLENILRPSILIVPKNVNMENIVRIVPL